MGPYKVSDEIQEINYAWGVIDASGGKRSTRTSEGPSLSSSRQKYEEHVKGKSVPFSHV